MSPLAWMLVVIMTGRGVSDLLAWRRDQRSGQSRLAELRAGAPETYFEERRELETWPSRGQTPPLWQGFLYIGLGAAMAVWFSLLGGAR